MADKEKKKPLFSKPIKKKNLASKDLSGLRSEEVPDINLSRASKLFKEGKIAEADEAYDRFKRGIGRIKD